MQHGGNDENKIESSEGQRVLSCCNEVNSRCPSLVIDSNEETELDLLAKILVDAFYDQLKHDRKSKQRNNEEEGSYLLSSVHKRTG